MSDRLIEMGVTVKDIVLLFVACMVATVVVYYLMVYLVGFGAVILVITQGSL